MNGKEKSLLIDTGLGISNIYDEVRKLTDKPIAAVATHIHWDHIGGHKYFPEFYAHAEELDWLDGKFPLTIETVKEMVVDRCDLPDGFHVDDYVFFQGIPTKVLNDHDVIDIGGREIEVLHTPGHSPGHLCFWEKDRGYLFTGDLVYKDTLFAYYPSTDPEAYLASLEKVAALPVKKGIPCTSFAGYTAGNPNPHGKCVPSVKSRREAPSWQRYISLWRLGRMAVKRD